MKILQLATKVPYPPKDGGAAGIFVFSKTFVKLGHSVVILAFNPPKHFISSSALSDLPAALKIHTVEISTKPSWYKALYNLIFQTIPYQVSRFVNHKFENKLIEILHQEQPEVVQLEGVYLCPYISTIRKYSKAKVVLRSHNVEHILWQNIADNETNIVKRLYLNIQAKRVKKYEIAQIAKVDGLTTVTSNDLAIIESYQPKIKAKVMPFGIVPGNHSPNDVPNKDSISFIGALDWIPNQEAILWFIQSVWPLIHDKYPTFQFHIAGRNAPDPLKFFIEQQQNIVFHGEVADATMFFNQFSILVVPLFAGSGIRVKIIEAMEHGLVVIASTKAVDGIPAISGQQLLIADTAEDFLKELTRLLEDSSLMAQISSNAMGFVREKFNIFAIGSELIDFYNKIGND